MSSWIKVSVILHEKPEVTMMAGILDCDELCIVGRLVRVWSWFDQHTTDGVALRANKKLIDRMTNQGGFADAMIACGWLKNDENGVSIPDFDAHNGESAKKRAQTAKRVAKSRSIAKAESKQTTLPKKTCNAESVTDVTHQALAREDKIREEEIREDIKEREKEEKAHTLPHTPDPAGSNSEPNKPTKAKRQTKLEKLQTLCPDFIEQEQWNGYLESRSEKKHPMTEHALKLFSNSVQAASSRGFTVEQIMNECISAGWRSVKPEWMQNRVGEPRQVSTEPKANLFGPSQNARGHSSQRYSALKERLLGKQSGDDQVIEVDPS